MASGAPAALAAAFNLVKRPLVAAGRGYNAAAQRSPFAVGTATTVVKTSAADLFAQCVMEKKEFADVDWKRHGLFCTFGLFYLGGFQYYLYNHLFSRWCASITARVGHRGSAPIKTFIDQAIHHPFCYFPTFYLLKGAVEERPLASTWAKYKAELWENCKALWTIWVPAQMVNFALVPRHLRIPYVAGVSFLWTVVISCMRGAVERAAPAAAPATAQVESAAAAVAAAAAPAQAVASPLERRGAGGGGSGGGGDAGSSSSISSSGGSSGGAGAGGSAGLKALVQAPAAAEARA